MIQDVARNRYLEMLKTAFGQDIMDYMEQKDVIEIMLNPNGQLFIETLSGKQETGIEIPADRSENIVKLVAAYKNDVADVKSPSVSTELPFHGERFQGWLPPVVNKPTFAIRKRALHIFTLSDYVTSDALTESCAELLRQAVKARKNIVVVGGTGSGKTTFANALLTELKDSQDRLLVLEDLPELQVETPDCVTLSTTPDVTMRDLVKGSLRMRPDRIIIGEVRDGAALELLKAWNTGHPGGICTIHANGAESTPARLEDLIQEVVVTVPRNLILQAVDLIIYIERDRSGQRRVQDVVELVGYDKTGYQFQSLG